MRKKINVEALPEFDLAEHLETDEDIATYLSVVLEDNDSSEIRHALGMVARARGMTEVTPTADIRLASRMRKESRPPQGEKIVNRN